MRNIAMRLMYDGGEYHGWQYQKNGITVQQAVEDALSDLLGEDIRVIGCSRTDAGVHALDYVMNFKSNTNIPADKLPYALNCRLGKSIVSTKAWDVPENFHSRFSAKGKRYIYKIWNSRIKNPFLRNYSWYMPYNMDRSKMAEAAGYFIGTHDFSAFMAAGGSQKTTVRTVKECFVKTEGDLITVTVEADAFLYNMVRIITGTLAEVGFCRIAAEDIPDIIASGERRRSGLTAPPEGLFLEKVYF